METERDTQRTIRVAVLVLCGIAVALVACVSVIAVENWSTDVAVAIAVLGLLAIAAMNFDVPTSDSVGMSGTAMIFIGSLVVFRAQNFAIGPAIVGICAAIDFRHIREAGMAQDCVQRVRSHDLAAWGLCVVLDHD